MDAQARLRVNLAQREFEVAGSEAFVRDWLPRIEALLARLDAPQPTHDEPMAEPATAGSGHAPLAAVELGSFGEFLQRLPGSATETDRMLAAGFWMQQRSSDGSFATADANRRLLEQGIKVGNASQCVRQSLAAKRVFVVQRGRFRVSQHGRLYLRQLMGTVVPE